MINNFLGAMAQSVALSTILDQPSTIRFLEGSDNVDLGAIDLSKNPQKSSNGSFVWLSADRSEVPVTVVGKVIYNTIGDKTGPYFSLPEKRYVSGFVSTMGVILRCLHITQMPEVAADEMAKAKVGFAIRFINRELVVDSLLPDKLRDHNQAALEYFLTIQEAADQRLSEYNSHIFFHLYTDVHLAPNGCGAKPATHIRSFLKVEDVNPFYVLPVISEPLFPQFKERRSPAFVRTKRQLGVYL